jgi:hypothetical protein
VRDGSPGSREAEGEGGVVFYIAQSGRCPDLLVIWGGEKRSTKEGEDLQVQRFSYPKGAILGFGEQGESIEPS